MELKQQLKSLNIYNVSVFDAEETIGWKQHAPYDGIVVSAAAPSIPKSLIQQLKNGGRMVIPLGDKFSQQLTLVKKHENKITTEVVNDVRFVPLVTPFAQHFLHFLAQLLPFYSHYLGLNKLICFFLISFPFLHVFRS